MEEEVVAHGARIGFPGRPGRSINPADSADN